MNHRMTKNIAQWSRDGRTFRDEVRYVDHDIICFADCCHKVSLRVSTPRDHAGDAPHSGGEGRCYNHISVLLTPPHPSLGIPPPPPDPVLMMMRQLHKARHRPLDNSEPFPSTIYTTAQGPQGGKSEGCTSLCQGQSGRQVQGVRIF